MRERKKERKKERTNERGKERKEIKNEREAVIDGKTRASPRHVGAPGRLIIWCPFKP
jgi:hypothetical protein